MSNQNAKQYELQLENTKQYKSQMYHTKQYEKVFEQTILNKIHF